MSLSVTKQIIPWLCLPAFLIILSFSTGDSIPYHQKYQLDLRSLKQEQASIINQISLCKNENLPVSVLLESLQAIRFRFKYLDFWLRYLEPNAYKLVNGVMPVEWETEVFEKFEKPYKRPGAGWFLTMDYLQSETPRKDSVLALLEASQLALNVFESDSIQTQVKDPSVFYFCNRLFLLNLASIYTTGFECGDTTILLKELERMMIGVENIYNTYNQSFPESALSSDYLKLYQAAFEYVKIHSDSSFHAFNHFLFIKDFVNPLFSINQHLIRKYQFETFSRQDYTLNSQVNSIFDKNLYQGQDSKGIFFYVKDSAILKAISRIGKQLFYDPILSGNNERSCASCHKPSQGFTDSINPTSLQFNQTEFLSRNTPSLLNVVHYQLLMLDGKHISLQNQAKDVSSNPIEMGGKLEELLEKVLQVPHYKKAFQSWLKFTPTEKQVSMDHIVSALSLYYGQFSYFYSPFDKAFNQPGYALEQDAIDGFNLFMGKGQCATCHFLPQFNGSKPPYVSSEFEVLGVPSDTTYKKLSEDLGRYGIHPVSEMHRAFRTPGLRNVTRTAPYFHNGSFQNLEQVFDFYNAGGGQGKGLQIDNQTLGADSLRLSKNEKQKLLAFMRSLTEEIPVETPPEILPSSKSKKLENRKPGGNY